MSTQRDTILIVDDRELNRVALRTIFEGEFNLLEAENGEQALVLIRQYHGQLAAMLLDIIMPAMDGYQVLEAAGKDGFLQEFPVVVITADASADSEVRAFDLGASDIIVKPFEPHVVRRRVQNIVDLNLRKLHQDELIEKQAARLRESNAVMIEALSSVIEYRSLETGQHIQRIRLFTRALLEDVAKSWPEYLLDERRISIITSASSLHDIGKIAVPDAILNKPGRLTAEEYEIMKTHAAKGAEMLTTLERMGDREYLRYAYNICRYHHERWDGRGYPDGLKGDAIPLCAQVVGVADCYDALTNDRVYKKAIPPEQAINMILNGECGAFAPRLLESLKNVQGSFARLTAQYIDTAPAEDGAELPAPGFGQTLPERDALDAQQMAQLKYYTLLRQMEATVMEVDFATGLYHVVYLYGEAFGPLRSGAVFEETFRNFVQAAVHPDDRALALEALGGYVDELFDEGLVKRERRYRVFRRDLQHYVWCRASLLRVDTEIPHQRKALILWREEPENAPAPVPAREDELRRRLLRNVIGSVQRCRMDKWFTIDHPSEGLLTFLGYSAAELREKFANRYLNLICPEDRPEVQRQLKRQMDRGDAIELTYRLTARDGRLVWTLEKSICARGDDGEEYLYFVLIDISQSRQIQQKLRLLSERYQLLLEQIDDITFEWDIRRDVLDLSPNFREKFGYAPIRDNAAQRLSSASHLHPEDLALIAGAASGAREGKAPPELEVRIADAEGRYRWYKVRMALQRGDDGLALRVVGAISDIDAEKQHTRALEEEAERDGLTGLYNRRAAQQRITRRTAGAERPEEGAMLLFDLDNFKQVNDHYGHLFGDEVLRRAAGVLRQLAAPGDVTARVGGDEFLIYSDRDAGAAESLAQRACRTLREEFTAMMKAHRPTCSVGIALCPRDGTDFDALFHGSDVALYRAKAEGKDRTERYDAGTMENVLSAAEGPLAANTRIDSERD